jgi:hypothetical protein
MMSCLFDYVFMYVSNVDSMFMTMSMSNVFSVLLECMCLLFATSMSFEYVLFLFFFFFVFFKNV